MGGKRVTQTVRRYSACQVRGNSRIFKDISQEDLTITDSGTYTVSGTTTQYVITVNNGCNPTIILDDVNIDVSGQAKPAISAGNNCNVTIILKENIQNKLKSGYSQEHPHSVINIIYSKLFYYIS